MIDDIKRFIIPKKYFSNIFKYLCQMLIIILFQEGLRAIAMHRMSYWLYKNNYRGLAFCLAKTGLFLNSIYIAPSTQIGKGCKINHGGTVIHAKHIGINLEATHNVTIGQLKTLADAYPEIGNNVYIGAGARIFANIGNNVIIGANCVVLNDIPDNCRATGVPAITKTITPPLEPLAQ